MLAMRRPKGQALSQDKVTMCLRPWSVIAQLDRHRWVPLSRQNRIYNRQAGNAGDFADYVVNLKIHLCQRFLHMLNVPGGDLHQR
jgi:hypothetical protein